MPHCNRVQPDGQILADPARGRFMGNRGILHDATGRLGPALWRHKAWITCALHFKGRHRALLQPGRYTELFFHDEAVAFAAGHRPCGECRRRALTEFRAALDLCGPIADFDTCLHAARCQTPPPRQRRHMAALHGLPDGAFILGPDGQPMLVRGDALHPFRPGGYAPPRPRAGGTTQVTVLTPAPLLQALRGGYRLTLALPDA